MNTIKNFYSLIGSEQKLENWVVTCKDRPDLLFATNETDLISASSLPLLFFHQLPLSWKQKDPGFKILMRDQVNEKLPEWIISPQDYEFVPRSQHQNPKKILIINHHQMSEIPWNEFKMKYPESEIKWTSYATQEPNWPLKHKIDFRLFCYHPGWIPERVIDLNYGQGDTISPIHLHAFENGADSELNCPNLKTSLPRYILERPYGTWRIY